MQASVSEHVFYSKERHQENKGTVPPRSPEALLDEVYR